MTLSSKESEKQGEITMDEPIPKELYDILACPVDKADLEYSRDKKHLICQKCHVKYPIKEGIPVLLPPDMQK